MFNWPDFSSNWSATLDKLRVRVPLVDVEGMLSRPRALEDLTAHIAETHDLTDGEAREELTDWMLIQSLARKAPDIRAT